eukprot:70471-Amphidinium_carterae.1
MFWGVALVVISAVATVCPRSDAKFCLKFGRFVMKTPMTVSIEQFESFKVARKVANQGGVCPVPILNE